MSKILLTHSYFLALDKKQKKNAQPYAPLATLFAASVLRANNFAVSVLDVMFAENAAVAEKAIQNESPDFFVICDDGFNYLTKMCLTNMREAAFEMIRFAKRAGCKVIVSSSDSTDHTSEYLNKGADYIVIGEAEQTLLELIQNLSASQSTENIAGIAYRSDDTVIRTDQRKVTKELDTIPLPAWDLVDLEPYRKTWMRSKGYFSLNIVTTRGCPYKCNWCAKPIYGNRYNSRSPQNVIDEILLLKKQYIFEHIWFCDDIFGLKPCWVQEFALLVKQHQLQFKFTIQSRADLLTQEGYVKALHDAGCQQVWMGAESGSQKILDAMDKGITVGQIEEATRLLKENFIEPCFFIQFGYPSEKYSDIQLTVQMIKRLQPAAVGISVSYPLPGTKFYENVKAQLQQKSNWTDSDDLTLMFRNEYSPSFYKQLHRYVHKVYRKEVAFRTFKHWMQAPFKMSVTSFKKSLALSYYVLSAYRAERKLKKLRLAS